MTKRFDGAIHVHTLEEVREAFGLIHKAIDLLNFGDYVGEEYDTEESDNLFNITHYFPHLKDGDIDNLDTAFYILRKFKNPITPDDYADKLKVWAINDLKRELKRKEDELIEIRKQRIDIESWSHGVYNYDKSCNEKNSR